MLILDDAMSELDRGRRKKLLEFLKGIQTVITCTDADDELLGFADKVFFVEKGNVKNLIENG